VARAWIEIFVPEYQQVLFDTEATAPVHDDPNLTADVAVMG